MDLSESQSLSSINIVQNNSVLLEKSTTVHQNRMILQNQESMENTCINVSFCSKCNGMIGVPISFLDKYCPEQFDILGYDGNDFCEELGIKEIGHKWCNLYRKQGGTGHMSPSMHSVVLLINDRAKTVYKRIFIRRKDIDYHD